jgi:hypothetical protein
MSKTWDICVRCGCEWDRTEGGKQSGSFPGQTICHDCFTRVWCYGEPYEPAPAPTPAPVETQLELTLSGP